MAAETFRWNQPAGADGLWDTATHTPKNWLDNNSVAADWSEPGNDAIFNDSAVGLTPTLNGVVNPNSVQFQNNGKDYTLNANPGGAIAGAGNFVKSGSFMVTLNVDANTFTGGSEIMAGTIQFGGSTSVSAGVITRGPLGTGAIALNPTSTVTLMADASDRTLANAVTVGGSGVVIFGTSGGGKLIFDGQATGNKVSLGVNSDFNVATGATVAFTAIDDSPSNFTLTKSGDGTMELAAFNAFSNGNLTVADGTLKATANDAIFTNNTTLAASIPGDNAELNIVGFDQELLGTLTLGGAAGSTSTVNTGTNTLKLGNGGTQVVYSATNNPGAATINGKVELGFSTTFDVADSTGVTPTGATGELVMNAVVSGTGAQLTKTGAGVMVLTAANTYNGGTSVQDGTLQVNGSIGSGTTVGKTGGSLAGSQNAAVLAGTGTVNNALTVGSGSSVGVLKPGGIAGGATGTMTVTGATTVANGSQVQLQLTSRTLNDQAYFNAISSGATTSASAWLTTDPGAATHLAAWNINKSDSGGGDYDYLNLSGSLSLGDSAGAHTWGEGTVLVINSGYSAQVGDVFNLIDWVGGMTGGFGVGADFANAGGNFVSNDLDLPTLGSGLVWDVSAFRSFGIVAVVPEPSSAVLVLFGLMALVLTARSSLSVRTGTGGGE